MTFAIEVLLPPDGEDAFGQRYKLGAQRLRYELQITQRKGSSGDLVGVFVDMEDCRPIKKTDDKAAFLSDYKQVRYGGNRSPFIKMREGGGGYDAIEIRQDGSGKHGRPVTLPIGDASRTALSTVSTSEFPHLNALKEFFTSIQFLQIDPQSARRPSDRLAGRLLDSNGSNLATVLARIQSETKSEMRPNGVLSDIAAEMTALIPSIKSVIVKDDERAREYSFDIELLDDLRFSSRVISDGTLRLLALLTVLNDPHRKGILCFEEPENGVHEGRISQLVKLLRKSVSLQITEEDAPYFQVLTNTHSPAVMAALKDNEIIAADVVATIDPKSGQRTVRTRMRGGILPTKDLFEPEKTLTRGEIDALLKRPSEAA
jgi:predicted ATPase